MGKLSREKQEALGEKYIGKHGNKLKAPKRGKKSRVERAYATKK